MNGLLTLFNGNRNIAINALFPANSVFDLDATIAASYSSGQLWKNLITSPADGAAQSAYDFYLGANNSTSTDDPTFTGTAGNPNAYFACDGGDYFTLAGVVSNAPTINTMHQRLPHSLIMCLYHDEASATTQSFFTSGNSSDSTNVCLSYKCGSSQFFYRQRLLTGVVNGTRSSVSGSSAGNKIIIFSYNPATDSVISWLNTSSGTTTSVVFTSTSLTQTGSAPKIGAVGAGLDTFINGTKIYSCALLNSTITDSDAAKIIKFYNNRHKRIYA